MEYIGPFTDEVLKLYTDRELISLASELMKFEEDKPDLERVRQELMKRSSEKRLEL